MKTLFISELANQVCFWLDFIGILLWGCSVALLVMGMKKAFNDKMRAAFYFSLGGLFVFLCGFFLIMLSKLYQ